MNKYKIFALSLLALFCVGFASAQNSGDTVEKKNKKQFVLPKAGDISLSIDVVPMFKYLGNLHNGTTNNQYGSFGGEETLQNLKYLNPVLNPTVSIMGKYMITDNIAARLNIGLMTVHKNERKYAIDDEKKLINPLSEAEVIDSKISNTTGASFAIGAEYRRGYRWIQGLFGLDLNYGFSENNIRYEYGNALTEINQSPTRNFGSYTDVPSYWSSAYTLHEYNETADSYIGLSAHVGVELFFTSYLSLGGEVSLAALWQIGSPHYAIIEGFNTANNTYEHRTETLDPGNRAFIFGTKNLGGKLYLSFYF